MAYALGLKTRLTGGTARFPCARRPPGARKRRRLRETPPVEAKEIGAFIGAEVLECARLATAIRVRCGYLRFHQDDRKRLPEDYAPRARRRPAPENGGAR
jgi:hypothetical protein